MLSAHSDYRMKMDVKRERQATLDRVQPEEPGCLLEVISRELRLIDTLSVGAKPIWQPAPPGQSDQTVSSVFIAVPMKIRV